jgi:hypothetical protein
MKLKKICLKWSLLFAACMLLSCSRTEIDTFGNIYGIVTDLTGAPVQTANVTLTPGGRVTATGSNGQYEYLDLSPGQYTIQVICNGYQTDVKRITVLAGETVQGDFLLKEISQE